MKPLIEIIKGISIASVGMVATSLFIIGLSQLYIAKWTSALVNLFLAALLFAAFYHFVIRFLNALALRFDTTIDNHPKTNDE